MLFIPLPMRGVAQLAHLPPSLQPCCNTVISKRSLQFGSDVISISAARAHTSAEHKDAGLRHFAT